MLGPVIRRIAIVFGILLFWSLVFIIGTITIAFRGPSVASRDLLVTTLMETSAAKFIPTLYFSEDEILSILAQNTVTDSENITDGSLIETPPLDSSEELQQIEIIDVYGATYKGKMMIVHDPSRLYVATPPFFDDEKGGLRVEEMVRRDGAVAGINAGGFEDINGVGNGGKPLGLVIQNGVVTHNKPHAAHILIGFDADHKLVIGKMNAEEAVQRNIRDAVTFFPSLIVNGEPMAVSGTGGGLNPRTAIGQRADGAVLLLVIDGRQPHSIGANYQDLINVMMQFEAINAANLDGGSSTLMIYEDTVINVCASLYGSRKLPTAILVRQVS